MDYEIKTSKNLDPNFLNDILKLDAMVYQDDLQGSYDSLKDRLDANDEMYLLLYKKEELIGYVCFFPITKKLSDSIYNDSKIHDDDITKDDIENYSKNKKTDIYILSIVINPNTRGKEATTLLINSFVQFIDSKIKEGYKIGKVLGTIVSDKGERFAKNLGLKVVKRIEDNYLLMDCDGEKLQNKYYKKTYQDDVYIMIPFTGKISKINEEDNELANNYIEVMNKYSYYECNDSIASELKRKFIGKETLMCLSDDYDGTISGKETAYLFLTSHETTNLHILTILIPNNHSITSEIQDNAISEHLTIEKDNNIININDYIFDKYNLVKCGACKTIMCMSKKPDDQLELYNLLSAEVYKGKYNTKYTSGHITSKEIITSSEDNISQYKFYEAYVSLNSILYIFNDFNNDFSRNIEYEALILFIVELTIFQNSAISRTNKKIVDGLKHEGNVSLTFIEQLYKEFGKTSVFWNTNNFKYNTSQNLANKINDSFKTKEMLEAYQRNQSFLEHIVDLKNVQESNKENMLLNLIALILTILQVIPLIVQFLKWVVGGNTYIAYGTTGTITLFTIFIIVIIIKRKNNSR